MTRSLVSIALVLGASSACAHRAPVERNSVSVVTNEEVTDDTSNPEPHTMSYTKVNEEDALNHDRTHEEHEAMYGTLGRTHSPQPALSEAPAEENEAANEQNLDPKEPR